MWRKEKVNDLLSTLKQKNTEFLPNKIAMLIIVSNAAYVLGHSFFLFLWTWYDNVDGKMIIVIIIIVYHTIIM